MSDCDPYRTPKYIFDYQAEHDVAGAVAKQAWGVGALVVTVAGKVLNQVNL